MIKEYVNTGVALASFAILWTTSVIGGMVWLESRFRRLEKTIYREIGIHEKNDEARFDSHGIRLERLEAKTFGFTRHS